MLLRRVSVLGTLLMAGVLAPFLALPVGADIVGEGVTALRCSESDDITMPKKMEFMQAVLSDDFEGYDQVALLVEAEYAEAVEVNRGQIVATVFLVKADGGETRLGKLKAKIRDSEASAFKVVDAQIEAGDFLNWKIKTKSLPPLLSELEDCLNFYFIVAVADEEL